MGLWHLDVIAKYFGGLLEGQSVDFDIEEERDDNGDHGHDQKDEIVLPPDRACGDCVRMATRTGF